VLLGTTLYGRLGNVLKITPPLNIPDDQLDSAIRIFERAVSEVEASASLA
jgi:4-aminobutyrate aminotransferase-like enzyme